MIQQSVMGSRSQPTDKANDLNPDSATHDHSLGKTSHYTPPTFTFNTFGHSFKSSDPPCEPAPPEEPPAKCAQMDKPLPSNDWGSFRKPTKKAKKYKKAGYGMVF